MATRSRITGEGHDRGQRPQTGRRHGTLGPAHEVRHRDRRVPCLLTSQDRYDRLRAFATALGAALRGKAWLFALGQQQIDDQSEQPFAVWVRDRFPPQLRVHLAATNIRDVVHQRLLEKTPAASRALAELFERHRADLKLYAYGCDTVTSVEFVEIYPMLPGQIELILQITTALRTRTV